MTFILFEVAHNKYHTKLVERAVIIMRNPHHALQDIFLQCIRSYEHLNHRDHEWLPKFVMNNEGFHHHCKHKLSNMLMKRVNGMNQACSHKF